MTSAQQFAYRKVACSFYHVENNPINFIDPWGEDSIVPFLIGGSFPRIGGGIIPPFPGPTIGGKSKDRVPTGLGIDGNYVADEAKDKAKGEEENKGKEQPVKPKPDDHLKGGKQGKRDRWHGKFPDQFKRWFDKNWNKYGQRNVGAEEMKEAYGEWLQRGKPDAN